MALSLQASSVPGVSGVRGLSTAPSLRTGSPGRTQESSAEALGPVLASGSSAGQQEHFRVQGSGSSGPSFTPAVLGFASSCCCLIVLGDSEGPDPHRPQAAEAAQGTNSHRFHCESLAERTECALLCCKELLEVVLLRSTVWHPSSGHKEVPSYTMSLCE